MVLDIIIVGTGIGGLAAALALQAKGHRVVVLEAAPELQAVGGIIVIQANGCRLLDHLGVYQPLMKICRPKPFTKGARRYEDGSWLRRDRGLGYDERYGYPLWNVHRADYQRVLYDAAVDRGVITRFNCRVESLDEDGPSVIIKGGEVVKGDIILGADGIKSVIRRCMYPESESAALVDTGLDITRVNIPFEILNRHPDTADMTDHIALWFGPRSCVANVPIQRDGEWLVGYDFLAPRSEHSSPERPLPQDFAQMKTQFDGWDSRIRATLFGIIDDNGFDAYVWQMYESRPAEWVSKSGKVAILGDAAHGFTPWIGQGGTMAVEDAVALAECLSEPEADTFSDGSTSEATDSESTSSAGKPHMDIGKRLRLYQQIRQPRAFAVQARSKAMGEVYLLPDGPHQQMRDKVMLGYDYEMDKETADPDPEKFRVKWKDVMPTPEAPTQEWDDWVVGFDGVEYTKKKLAELDGSNQLHS